MSANELLYDYLQEALDQFHLQYPWRLIYDEKIKHIIIQALIPVRPEIKAADLADLKNTAVSQIDYIELQLIYGQATANSFADDLHYYIAPNVSRKYYDKTFIDITLQVLAQLISTIETQLNELAGGKRRRMAIDWPEEAVWNMVKDRKRINRYNAERLVVSKEN